MEVFISYHRVDTKYRKRIATMLEEQGYTYYAVPEDACFDGDFHQTINNKILPNVDKCNVLLCIVGKETYQRAHVDWELHRALKGDTSKRKGIIAVMLEERNDSKNDINYETFPPRLADNEEYIILEQFASLNDRLEFAIEASKKNSKDAQIQTNNQRTPMPVRHKKYYDN